MVLKNNKQEEMKLLSSSFSKLLKKRFGKGPEKCAAYSDEQYVVIHIRTFLSLMEEALLKEEKVELIDEARNVIMKSLTPDILNMVETVLNLSGKKVFYDWNYERNIGVVIIELDASYYSGMIYQNQYEYEKEIISQSRYLHKTPDAVSSSKITNNIVLLDCVGALLPIELTLIHKGFANLLFDTKTELRKQYEESLLTFYQTMGMELEEFFIAWDYQSDRRILCLIRR